METPNGARRSPSTPRQIAKQSLWTTQTGPLVEANTSAMHSYSSTVSSFTNFSLSSQDIFLERQCSVASGDDILLVSERVTGWQRLLRNLLAPEDSSDLVNQLEADSRQFNWKVQDVCAKALGEWIRRKGDQATITRLLSSLENIHRKDVSDDLKKRYCFTSPDVPEFDQNEDKVFEEEPSDTEGLRNSKEVEKILSELNDPKKFVICLVGPPKSGKITSLNILYQKIQEGPFFESTRVVRIVADRNLNSNGLNKKIIEEITRKPQAEADHSKKAARALNGLLENYNEIILILDLSLISLTQTGRSICECLLKLRKDTRLATKLKIVVSAVTSLKRTSLYAQNRHSSVEVVAKPLSEQEAMNFIREKDPSFSKRIANLIVSKIECFPFYLTRITERDIESAFVVDNKEDLLRYIECKFEEVEKMLYDEEVKETLEAIMGNLNVTEKRLLIQVLTFTSRFNIEQANRIVNCRDDLEDSTLNVFCEQGTLFLSRECVDFKGMVYNIPRVNGYILRSLTASDDTLKNSQMEALAKHQEMFLNLTVLLSNCFMGLPIGAREELRVLEPFTPSDGVPVEMSLAQCSTDKRVQRIVRLFRETEDDIIKSLMICSERKSMYEPAVRTATQLNVFHFLIYMLKPMLVGRIYRRMKREALNYKDNAFVAKLNVCIASMSIHINGNRKFSSEAKSLFQASLESLEELKCDDSDTEMLYTHCWRGMGVCLLAESLKRDGDTSMDHFNKGMEYIKDAKTMLLNLAQQTLANNAQRNVVNRAYAADCDQLQTAFSLETTEANDAQDLLTESTKMLEDNLGREHPFTCNAYFVQSMLHMKKNEFKEAKRILYSNLEMEKVVLGIHWQTAKTLYEIASCIRKELQANGLDDQITPTMSDEVHDVRVQDQKQMEAEPSQGFSLDSDVSDHNQVIKSERTRNDTITASQFNGDELKEMRSLLKQAARFALFANGKCKLAQNCFLMLAETSRLLGKRREENYFNEKAIRCLKVF
ncbi:uncharacterized protein LOC135680879 isoform X2 [Rhopilema esculentum]|uniref:uncharacterized protein LOC135680879 isoform X2 n=1 Tax=Rhopilema esculentum TaxID=499914 RepID=UPI0031D24E17